MAKKEIKQPQTESEIVRILVTLSGLIMVIAFGMIYAGHWIGFILLALGLIVFIILEIGGWRK